jgi:hypothetical protein
MGEFDELAMEIDALGTTSESMTRSMTITKRV